MIAAKTRKRRKKSDRIGIGKDVLADFEDGRTEVNQQPVLDARRAEIAEELRDVLTDERADGFQFDDQLMFDKQVSKKLAELCAVFVENVERVLLDGGEVLFSETVGESVFVNFLDVAVTETAVQREAGFADMIAELEYGIFHTVPFLRLLRFFAA